MILEGNNVLVKVYIVFTLDIWRSSSFFLDYVQVGMFHHGASRGHFISFDETI